VSGKSIDVSVLQESQDFYSACNLFYRTRLFHLIRDCACVCVRLESDVSIRQKQQTATGLLGLLKIRQIPWVHRDCAIRPNPVADQRQHDSCWDFVSGYTITITSSNIVFGLSEGGNTRTHTTSGVGFVFCIIGQG